MTSKTFVLLHNIMSPERLSLTGLDERPMVLIYPQTGVIRDMHGVEDEICITDVNNFLRM